MRKRAWILCFAAAVIVLLFTSAASPLSPINMRNDTNEMLTIGKSVFRGKVLYRDIFGQKGLYAYLLYGLIAQIPGSFCIFLLEMVCTLCFIFFAGRYLLYYLNEKMTCLILLLMSVFLADYLRGGSVEELCLPFMMILLFHATEMIEGWGSGIRGSKFFVDGFLAAILLWINWYVCWLPLVLFLIYGVNAMNREREDWKPRFLLLALAGFLAGFLPGILYFAVAYDLRDFFMAYVGSRYYFKDWTGNPLPDFHHALLNFLGWARTYLLFLLIAIAGIVAHVRRGKMYLLFSFLVMMYGNFLLSLTGDSLPSLYLLLFVLYGLRVMAERWEDLRLSVALAAALCLCYVAGSSDIRYWIVQSQEDFAVPQLAEMIEEDKPSILCYDCGDFGLYRYMQAEPPVRYYCRPDWMSASLWKEAQEQEIREGTPKYVVMVTVSDKLVDLENYERVNCLYQGVNVFQLYRKKQAL